MELSFMGTKVPSYESSSYRVLNGTLKHYCITEVSITDFFFINWHIILGFISGFISYNTGHLCKWFIRMMLYTWP